MQKVLTKDGSYTLLSEKYSEHYHSTSGAAEEAFKKFVEPCRIAELAKSGSVKILDICFGLGYNSAAAIDVALKENPNCKMEIIGIETDSFVLEQIENMKTSFENYSNLKNIVKIKLGDARKVVKEIDSGFDAVFLDPFSPKKCPELWTFEFFSDIIKLMKPGAVLATYSCARIVRENLKKAGFIVKDGPSVGRRAPSTIAIVPL